MTFEQAQRLLDLLQRIADSLENLENEYLERN